MPEDKNTSAWTAQVRTVVESCSCPSSRTFIRWRPTVSTNGQGQDYIQITCADRRTDEQIDRASQITTWWIHDTPVRFHRRNLSLKSHPHVTCQGKYHPFASRPCQMRTTTMRTTSVRSGQEGATHRPPLWQGSNNNSNDIINNNNNNKLLSRTR